jgi:hypothetical protein
MKSLLFLLLFCLTAGAAWAQADLAPTLDANMMDLGRHVIMPLLGFFLLCNFVLAAVKMVLNYLLKNKIIDSAVISPSIVERLLPGPQDEQNKVVKWIALLLSTGIGLAVCNWYLPLGLHSIIILLFSTAFGFLAYYLFVSRQAK